MCLFRHWNTPRMVVRCGCDLTLYRLSQTFSGGAQERVRARGVVQREPPHGLQHSNGRETFKKTTYSEPYHILTKLPYNTGFGHTHAQHAQDICLTHASSMGVSVVRQGSTSRIKKILDVLSTVTTRCTRLCAYSVHEAPCGRTHAFLVKRIRLTSSGDMAGSGTVSSAAGNCCGSATGAVCPALAAEKDRKGGTERNVDEGEGAFGMHQPRNSTQEAL